MIYLYKIVMQVITVHYYMVTVLFDGKKYLDKLQCLAAGKKFVATETF